MEEKMERQVKVEEEKRSVLIELLVILIDLTLITDRQFLVFRFLWKYLSFFGVILE